MASKSILAVIVLYKIAAGESQTFTSLQNLLRTHPEADDALEVVLCDNSPVTQKRPETFAGLYLSDTSNPGLARCYNKALEIAQHQSIPWVLLLDQDTTLTEEYLLEVVQKTREMGRVEDFEDGHENIVALVPKLVQGGAVQSPHAAPTFRHTTFDRNAAGLSRDRLYAFNSASVLRVQALLKIGGFDEKYWLDFLDHATFHCLQAAGGRLFVLRACLEHDLSANGTERKDKAAMERYRNVLEAEHQFYRRYGSVADRAYHRIRLLRGALGVLVKRRRLDEAVILFRSAVRM